MSNYAIAFTLVSIGLGIVGLVCAFFIAFAEASDEKFYSSDSKLKRDDT